jgi:hypothetical protein
LQEAEFISYVVTQYHACCTNGQIGISKKHTPVSTPTFVFDAMNEVLLEPVLQHLNEVVSFDLCLLCGYRTRYIQVFQVEQQNHKSDSTFVTK